MLSVKTARNAALNEILSFTYPRLHTGSCWYISFYAFDPAKGEMRRKRIRINSVGSASQKRKYASQLCHRLSEKLEAGWNPWVEADSDRGYKLFTDALVHYRNYTTKLLNDGVLRQSTYHDYMCFAHVLEEWNEDRPVPIRYVYQFDRTFCVRFLDYIYIERKNSPRARTTTIWLSCARSAPFLVQHLYLKERPTEGLVGIGKALRKRNAKSSHRPICSVFTIGSKSTTARSYSSATSCITC